jgi:hypothetical protein
MHQRERSSPVKNRMLKAARQVLWEPEAGDRFRPPGVGMETSPPTRQLLRGWGPGSEFLTLSGRKPQETALSVPTVRCYCVL